ncbi:MAG: TraM recognition domain-containing protein, partial [Gammaproteobacteria bacterium]
GQHRPTIDIPSIMNNNRILIVNLSKGELGEGPSYLLGAPLSTSFSQAAQARASIREEDRKDFHFYADEFQNFATDSFASILSEARKYRLSLTFAHQFLGQLPPLLRKAVLGNAGSLIAFRIGAEDAEVLAPELGIASPSALCELSNYQAWARLIHDGNPTDPFRLNTAYPRLDFGRADAVVSRTRARYTRPRAKVEAEIDRFISNPRPLS